MGIPSLRLGGPRPGSELAIVPGRSRTVFQAPSLTTKLTTLVVTPRLDSLSLYGTVQGSTTGPHRCRTVMNIAVGC
jgi:hypothetical protein